MQVLVLSDIHDHIWNLEKVINQVSGKVEAAIFCGDMNAPFTAKLLSGLDVPTWACLGNNDEDQIFLKDKSGDKFNWTGLAAEFGEAEIDGKKIAFCHYPRLGELLAGTGEYHAVFYGHTHVARNEMIGKTLLVNPGSVCGILGGHPDVASFALWDTQINTCQIVTLN